MFILPMPYRSAELARMFDDRNFDGSTERSACTPGAARAHSPALDVLESEQGWTVRLDVPGVAKDEVKIAIDGNEVSVDATATPASEPAAGERLVYRERAVKRYARRFTLPADVDQAASQAKLDNGVLTLNLAKKRGVPVGSLAVQ